MLFLLAGFAAAAEVSSGLTDGAVVFDVDYNSLGDDDDDTNELNYTKTITISNTGEAAENVSLSLSEITAGYTATLSAAEVEVAAASTADVTLSLRVPIDVDSGNQDIGTLTVDGTAYSIKTAVKTMLELKEIDVYVEGSKDTSINEDGDEIDNIKPGEDLELRFEIENRFDGDYRNGDIDNIEITVQFEDEDDEDEFGDDIDEELDADSLDADEEFSGEDVVLDISVPTDAEDGTYTLLIKLEGEDENNAKHTTEWKVDLIIDREKDDVQVERAELNDNSLSCGESTSLRVVMTNYGSNNQDEAALIIYNEELGLNEQYMDIFLDKDPDDSENSFSRTVGVNVDEDAESGEQFIEIRAFIDGDEQVHYKDISIMVEECSEEEDANAQQENTTTNTAENTVENKAESNGSSQPESESASTENQLDSSEVVATVENPYSTIDLFIAAVIVSFILIIAIIIILVVILLKK